MSQPADNQGVPYRLNAVHPQRPRAAAPAGGESSLAATGPQTLTVRHVQSAMLATLVNRGLTHGTAHASALVIDAAATFVAMRFNATKPVFALLALVLGPLCAAMIKEAIGERRKTVPEYSNTVQVPSATRWQAEQPRLMAGFYDSLASVGSAFTNAEIVDIVVPRLTAALLDRGHSESAAQGLAMVASFIPKRAVSAMFDTGSDLMTTFSKSLLPGAYADNVVNPRIDVATMFAGMIARLGINYGLTLPLGIPSALGKFDDLDSNARIALVNALVWPGLLVWICAKAELAGRISDFAASAEPPRPAQPPQDDMA